MLLAADRMKLFRSNQFLQVFYQLLTQNYRDIDLHSIVLLCMDSLGNLLKKLHRLKNYEVLKIIERKYL